MLPALKIILKLFDLYLLTEISLLRSSGKNQTSFTKIHFFLLMSHRKCLHCSFTERSELAVVSNWYCVLTCFIWDWLKASYVTAHIWRCFGIDKLFIIALCMLSISVRNKNRVLLIICLITALQIFTYSSVSWTLQILIYVPFMMTIVTGHISVVSRTLKVCFDDLSHMPLSIKSSVSCTTKSPHRICKQFFSRSMTFAITKISFRRTRRKTCFCPPILIVWSTTWSLISRSFIR